jgi:hypothetical protein
MRPISKIIQPKQGWWSGSSDNASKCEATSKSNIPPPPKKILSLEG